MHRLAPGLLLGFHGCDRKVAESLLSGENFKSSQNNYDWLGHGVYFWEANPKRAIDFSRELARRKKSPVVDAHLVGCVLNLGYCLDLTTKAGLDAVKAAYSEYKSLVDAAGEDHNLPQNHPDLLRRFLDCAVINHLHAIREEAGEPAFDSVRGVFIEGSELYPTSGFHHKTHIQIAIRNPDCIKGVFRVRPQDLK